MKGIGRTFRYRERSPIEWFLLGLVLSSHLWAAIWYLLEYASKKETGILGIILSFVLLFSAAAAIYEIFTEKRLHYYIALAVRSLLTFTVVPIIAGITVIEVGLYFVLVLSVCLHNPFPLSAFLSFGLISVILTLRTLILLARGVSLNSIFLQELEIGAAAVIISVTTGMMVSYREQLIVSRRENDRLDGLVDRLTRANLQYQEYAKTVEENSIEAERKRITRDIHDIVGYTLTNNITLMEAVTDMMRVNPLGVSALVNAARENSEEGLTRVRAALHVLRSQNIDYPVGIRAIEKLVDVFKRATGVEVECILPKDEWKLPSDVEYTVYHIVQESLMNAFRHGKAQRIRIFMNLENGTVSLLVRDNGQSAVTVKEGIGLAGMRERVESLHGKLVIRPLADGFEVGAAIPRTDDGEKHGTAD